MNKVRLRVNGVEHQVVVDGDLTLLDLLREQLHLTGAKQSCDKKGQCGACTVIVDGKATRSCLTKVAKLDGAEVITVEGLGTPANPHLIQEAFVLSGAIQCGFCTPGMIMAAKALLDENPDPSAEEIKHALRRNLCRCTGYVKIIEAVGACRSFPPRRDYARRSPSRSQRAQDRCLASSTLGNDQGLWSGSVQRRHHRSGSARAGRGEEPASARAHPEHRHLGCREDARGGGRGDREGHQGHQPSEVCRGRSPGPLRGQGPLHRRCRSRGGRADPRAGDGGGQRSQGRLRTAAGARLSRGGDGRGGSATASRLAQRLLSAAVRSRATRPRLWRRRPLWSRLTSARRSTTRRRWNPRPAWPTSRARATMPSSS